jgi:rubrerythrin
MTSIHKLKSNEQQTALSIFNTQTESIERLFCKDYNKQTETYLGEAINDFGEEYEQPHPSEPSKLKRKREEEIEDMERCICEFKRRDISQIIRLYSSLETLNNTMVLFGICQKCGNYS